MSALAAVKRFIRGWTIEIVPSYPSHRSIFKICFSEYASGKVLRFVDMRAQVHTKRDLAHTLRVQLKVRGRLVNWISAEDDEHFYASGIDVRYQLPQLFDLRPF